MRGISSSLHDRSALPGSLKKKSPVQSAEDLRFIIFVLANLIHANPI
jgi:hypothetical protein